MGTARLNIVMAFIRRNPWYARPWLVMATGLAASVLGTVSIYLLPSTRQSGMTPLVAMQGLLIFGGIGLMLISLEVHASQGEKDVAAGVRRGVRGVLAFSIGLGILLWLRVPFAVVCATAMTPRLSEYLGRACAWLGRP